MDKFATLMCHPDTPCAAVRSIRASVEWAEEAVMRLRYVVEGDIDMLLVPPPAVPERADGLWRHMCFELFITDGWCEAYREYNFAPSGAWAVYDFADYRKGMSDVALMPPEIRVSREPGLLQCDVTVRCGFAVGRIGLSAVIEEKGGGISYWALAHPPGKADFHHPACFAAELPAPPPS
ncbi:MAG: DOMON-like domain-containing protein [Sphingobium sp.]|nr:DOMON-like domain-containing protein [Sphingobium sp.]MCI1271800.1 DOMON-like domain-containing protein [Sphingobium sp.]MCI1756161.1 DOMON-like domain-containing protein [Sphingobium sp.]MCI2054163.1 DOMON-like domain-containing protein [Sphingobium sp.]